MTLVLFTADLHGNRSQYGRLVARAIQRKADHVILGGDLAPKRFETDDDFIPGQRAFLKDELPRLLAPLKEQKKDIRIFLMMGNDDVKVNMDVLRRYDGRLFDLLHRKRICLPEGYDLVGYGCVPITPFDIKDWERYDLSRVPEGLERKYSDRKKMNYAFKGFCGTKEGWKDYTFKPSTEKRTSIQKDLESKLFTENPERTIYVIHTPPNSTHLDKTRTLWDGIGFVTESIGSFAVREFIERYQPYATLHGHAHMSANITGRYKQKIGETVSISAGNHNTPSTVSVIEFRLENPWMARRKII